MKNKGTLFLVPTPIGNLADMTYRAVTTLETVDLIGAEDTRNSGFLLKHYNINTPMQSYHKFNEKQRTAAWIQQLEAGKNIALITDAGTPGISDPAAILVKEAISRHIEVSCLPGATAFVPALAASGLNTEAFCFLGFLPDKKKDWEELLSRVKNYPETLVFYEAPHRIAKSLALWLEFLGDREIVFAREISKRFETYHRGLISDFLQEEADITLKGEFVVLIAGFVPSAVDVTDVESRLKSLLDQGIRQSDAIRLVMQETGLPKNRMYDLALKIKNQG